MMPTRRREGARILEIFLFKGILENIRNCSNLFDPCKGKYYEC